FAAFAHLAEAPGIDEMIVDAFDLAVALLARRHADRKLQAVLDGKEVAGKRRLARPRRRRQDEDQAAAKRNRRSGHSRFWICSRNWSTTALRSSPMAVSERSFAFEHSVLTSRLNSCARK